MNTYTFIELENKKTGKTKTIGIKGDDLSERGRIAYWVNKLLGEYEILAMYQVDKPSYSEAKAWLNYVIGE